MQHNKYQYVELLISPGQASPFFTPQQYLQNRQIYGIDVYNSDDVDESRSNVAVATAAMVAGMFLNFYCTDINLPLQAIPNSSQYNGQGWGLWFRDVPAVKMHPVSAGTNAYVRDPFQMGGEFIDFQQSYVNITPTAQALITDGALDVVLILGISYK